MKILWDVYFDAARERHPVEYAAVIASLQEVIGVYGDTCSDLDQPLCVQRAMKALKGLEP